jgi:Flp pilus assembly protein TadG
VDKDRTRRFRRFRRDKAGATAVEFAIIVTPFLVLLLGIFQMLVLFFLDQTLQTATESAGRLLMTGTAQKAGYTQSQFKQAVCNYAGPMFNCGNIYVDVESSVNFSTLNITPPTMTYDKNGNPTNNFTYTPGTQTNAVIVRVMYNYPVWWGKLLPWFVTSPNNGFLLMATTVLRNEPYQ